MDGQSHTASRRDNRLWNERGRHNWHDYFWAAELHTDEVDVPAFTDAMLDYRLPALIEW
jgi:hypothetical protein